MFDSLDDGLKKKLEEATEEGMNPQTIAEAVVVAEMLNHNPQDCEEQILRVVEELSKRGDKVAAVCLAYGGGKMMERTKQVVLEMAKHGVIDIDGYSPDN